jgi:hypothetical protein
MPHPAGRPFDCRHAHLGRSVLLGSAVSPLYSLSKGGQNDRKRNSRANAAKLPGRFVALPDLNRIGMATDVVSRAISGPLLDCVRSGSPPLFAKIAIRTRIPRRKKRWSPTETVFSRPAEFTFKLARRMHRRSVDHLGLKQPERQLLRCCAHTVFPPKSRGPRAMNRLVENCLSGNGIWIAIEGDSQPSGSIALFG